jgi:ribonuclease E
MDEKRNNRAVERKLSDCLRQDRARIQVGRISHFGLLEMSRQRMRSGVLEGSTVKCPHCQGVGLVRSVESMALHVLRGVEAEAIKGRASAFTVKVPVEVAVYILNQKRANLLDIEERYGMSVYVEADHTLKGSEHRVEAAESRALTRTRPAAGAINIESAYADEEPVVEDIVDEVEDEEEETEEAEASAPQARGEARDEEREDHPRKRRRRRRRKSGQEPQGEQAAPGETPREERGETSGEDDEDEDEASVEGRTSAEGEGSREGGENGEDRPRKRRRRGRRGGRRNRGRDGAPEGAGEMREAADGDQTPDEGVGRVTGDNEEPILLSYSRDQIAAGAEPADEERTITEERAGIEEPHAAIDAAPDTDDGSDEEREAEELGIAVAEQPAAAEPADKPQGPQRRGWWQRRSG